MNMPTITATADADTAPGNAVPVPSPSTQQINTKDSTMNRTAVWICRLFRSQTTQIGRALAGIAALGAMWLAGAVLALPSTAHSAEVDAPINTGEARTFWRWVGLRPPSGNPCPGAEGWQSSQLFALDDTPLPPGLSRFCLYQLPDGVTVTLPRVQQLFALVNAGQLQRVQPDSMALSAEGVLEDRTWPSLQSHFLEQAGQPQIASWPGTQDSVRLAIVDTQPTNEVAPEQFTDYGSAHGFALTTLARQLLCSGPAGCGAQVTSRLALAFTCFDRLTNLSACRRDAEGGWFGLQSDLALAIRKEVAEWLSDTPPAPPPAAQTHLILNLSVGWNSRFGGPGPVSSLPLGAASVYAALQYASCHGALVLAAAGNQHGGPSEPEGPMYPAGWETQSAPSQTACQALLQPGAYIPDYAFPPMGQTDNRSLVYAVGGVRQDGGPIYNARVRGEPTLVAFADHAVTESLADPGKPIPVLTGTSVGTAVVSAAAAAAWRLSNGLRTTELLGDVTESAKDLGRDPDFCNGGTPANPCPIGARQVSQVRVCAVADCVDSNICNEPFPSCGPLTGLDLSRVDLTDFKPSEDLLELTETLSDPDCDPILARHSPAGKPDNPCLSKQYHGVNALPWTDPQPGDLPCPTCLVRFASPGTFYYEIDPDLSGVFTDATLLCGDFAYSLDIGTLMPGDTGAVLNIGEVVDREVQCADAFPIQLLLRDDDGRTTISPLLYLD
jgi:hypothetical protein